MMSLAGGCPARAVRYGVMSGRKRVLGPSGRRGAEDSVYAPRPRRLSGRGWLVALGLCVVAVLSVSLEADAYAVAAVAAALAGSAIRLPAPPSSSLAVTLVLSVESVIVGFSLAGALVQEDPRWWSPVCVSVFFSCRLITSLVRLRKLPR